MEEKHKVYVLDLDGTKAVHLDLGSLKDALEMEFDAYTEQDLETMEFKVYVKFMTDKELDGLPEFDGF